MNPGEDNTSVRCPGIADMRRIVSRIMINDTRVS